MPDEFSEVVGVLRDHGFVVDVDDVVLVQPLRDGGEVVFVYVVKGGVVLRLAIVKLDGEGTKVLGPEFLMPKCLEVLK